MQDFISFWNLAIIRMKRISLDVIEKRRETEPSSSLFAPAEPNHPQAFSVHKC